MLIVRRGPKSVNNFLLSTSSISSSSPHQMGPPPTPLLHTSGTAPSSTNPSNSSSTSSGGSQSQPFDFQLLLSPENKARTIRLLTLDKENLKGSKGQRSQEGSRKAAVLIPLCRDGRGRVCLLY